MFETIELNEVGLAKAEEIGKEFTRLLAIIEKAIPSGRERAIITTKLQEAAMFARVGLGSQKAYKKEE